MVIFSLLHQGHSLSQLGKPESIRNCSTTNLSGSHDLDQVFHFFGALFDAEAVAIFSQALWILMLLLVPSCQGAIDLLNNVNQAATSFFAHIRCTHIHPVPGNQFYRQMFARGSEDAILMHMMGKVRIQNTSQIISSWSPISKLSTSTTITIRALKIYNFL